MDVVELAQTLDVGSTKLEHLSYSLMNAGLLIAEGHRFSNTAEADHYLVRGKATYMGERHHQFSDQLNSILRTSESIRTGAAKAKLNFHEMTPRAGRDGISWPTSDYPGHRTNTAYQV